MFCDELIYSVNENNPTIPNRECLPPYKIATTLLVTLTTNTDVGFETFHSIVMEDVNSFKQYFPWRNFKDVVKEF